MHKRKISEVYDDECDKKFQQQKIVAKIAEVKYYMILTPWAANLLNEEIKELEHQLLQCH